MTCPSREALEAMAACEPVGAAAAEHAAGCAACARRVSWMRAEAAAVRRWAADEAEGLAGADVDRLWAGVEARLAQPGRSRRWIVPLAAAGLAAAIALVAVRGREVDAEATPSATVAVRDAEAEYRGAIAALEKQVAARPAGRSAALGRARSGLARARATAGSDPAARVRLLEGYAAYLKSLRRALQDDAS